MKKLKYSAILAITLAFILLPVVSAQSVPHNLYNVTYTQTNTNIQVNIQALAGTPNSLQMRATYYIGTTSYYTQVFNDSLSFTAPLENGYLIIMYQNGTSEQTQQILYQSTGNPGGSTSASPLGYLTLIATIMVLGSAFAGYIGSKIGSRGKTVPINSGMYKGKYFGADVEAINRLGTEEVNTPEKVKSMNSKAEELRKKYGKITSEDLKGGKSDEV